MNVSEKQIKKFQDVVWNYYHTSGRDGLPWRKSINAYRVWVSEIMLQQTQVDRVVGFFDAWIKIFPTVKDLAQASQIDVLKQWKGLGYNSRAIRMKQAAQLIIEKYKGKFPTDYNELQKLPGIGPYTAGAICAFVSNQPIVLIETNIRRVFIHHFFNDTPDVHDDEVLELVKKTMDTENPREWYWALMDYGSFLGRTLNIKGKKYNPNVQSKHYTKQSKFEGSDREIRSNILRVLLENNSSIQKNKLAKEIKKFSNDSERIEKILNKMKKDGYFEVHGKNIHLKK
jgi:A/G-specific adenine glycosylase